MKKATYIECVRCEFEECCSLRDIAADMVGCAGHSKMHHRYEERTAQLKKEAKTRMEDEKTLNEKKALTLNVGDKLKLKGSTISLGLNLPRYLDYGVFTFLGINRNGKAICDWDGGKPFHIPLQCLEKITK